MMDIQTCSSYRTAALTIAIYICIGLLCVVKLYVWKFAGFGSSPKHPIEKKGSYYIVIKIAIFKYIKLIFSQDCNLQ